MNPTAKDYLAAAKFCTQQATAHYRDYKHSKVRGYIRYADGEREIARQYTLAARACREMAKKLSTKKKEKKS